MLKDTEEELRVLLTLLKGAMIEKGVSMATDRDGNIYFFDTDTYIKTEKMSGFSVNVQEMVR